MGLLDGKKGVILGVANNKSIAWGIAEACNREGAQLAFTYLNESIERRVRPLAESLGQRVCVKCDASIDDDFKTAFEEIGREFGTIDFVVHSIAYAPGEDLHGRFNQVSRQGFAVAMDISVYSLIATVHNALPFMNKGGSFLTLSYYGAEKVVPNYHVMGIAKAALEASVREMASDLGPEQMRINAISAGPIKTLAASGISNFRALLSAFETRAPLRRLTTIEDVGASAVYLLSDYAGGVTGELHYVDCGFNITGL